MNRVYMNSELCFACLIKLAVAYTDTILHVSVFIIIMVYTHAYYNKEFYFHFHRNSLRYEKGFI